MLTGPALSAASWTALPPSGSTWNLSPSRRISAVSRISTVTFARGLGVRPNCTSKPSFAKTAASSTPPGRLHLPQRAARPAPQDPKHLWQPFRRVAPAPDSHRGGLLRQGSLLTVTSLRHPNVAGAPRQLDPGQPAETPPPRLRRTFQPPRKTPSPSPCPCDSDSRRAPGQRPAPAATISWIPSASRWRPRRRRTLAHH